MSANPKWNIVRPDRDDLPNHSTAELPADLQTIAERLSAEATELATRFPASPTGFAKTKAPSTSFRFGAAAILIGIAAGSAMLGWSLHVPRELSKTEGNRAFAETSRSEMPPRPMIIPPSPNLLGNSSGVQEVGFVPSDPKSSKLSEVEMLRIQLSAFEQVIRRLQDELDRRAKSEAETTKTIELLSREIEKLRHQLQSHPERESETTSQEGQRID
jgi:hypothetical protein